MLVLAGIYALFMMAGALGFRLPAPGWAPPGKAEIVAGGRFVPLGVASRTPQFWLVWCVLLLNVSASIGIIGLASPMVQEIFGGGLFDQPVRFADFNEDQKAAAAAAGAGFVGLISLFNIAGRFSGPACQIGLGERPCMPPSWRWARPAMASPFPARPQRLCPCSALRTGCFCSMPIGPA